MHNNPSKFILEHLDMGANRAEQVLGDLDIACLVRVCVTNDISAARQWLRRELTGYAIVEVYQRYLRQIGFGEETEAVDAKWRSGDRAGAMEEVSDSMDEQLAVLGTAAQCQAGLEQYAIAGINLPSLFPVSPDADYRATLYKTLAELATAP